MHKMHSSVKLPKLRSVTGCNYFPLFCKYAVSIYSILNTQQLKMRTDDSGPVL